MGCPPLPGCNRGNLQVKRLGSPNLKTSHKPGGDEIPPHPGRGVVVPTQLIPSRSFSSPEWKPLKQKLPFDPIGSSTWRIIPLSKWLATPIYKPFRPFIRGITLFRGRNRSPWLLTTYKSWDDPPSRSSNFEATHFSGVSTRG